MEGLFQRAIERVIDFFLTPVQTIFDFLTNPQTFMALTDRLADAIHTAEATLYSYQIPFIFTTLGLYLYLAGLAYALLAYLRGSPWTVFRPVLLGGILLPLFAYRGPGCTTEGYPCVPNVRYEIETIPSQTFKTYRETRFKLDNGKLVMEEVSRDTGIDAATPAYRVFRLKTDTPMPPGTAIGLSLVETSSLIGRNTFYSSLARYQENMSELRKVYQSLTRTAFSLMTGAAFTQRLGGILVESVVGAMIPLPASGKVAKSITEKVAKFFREKAPPFFRFVVGSGLATTVQGAQQVAARTAQVNLSIAQVLASLPLLLVLSFVGIFYIAILGAKLAVFAVPLGVAFMAFAPQATNRYLNYLVVLVVFPAVLGSFFSLATRVLFLNGIERQIQEFRDQSARMLDSYYIQNPTAAMVAAQVTNTVANQVKNLQACLKAPLPEDWEPGRKGRELPGGGPIGTVSCYPTYGIEAYLNESYQVPQDPNRIRTEAIAIARHFSLDLANLVAPDGRFLARQLQLPKGSVGGSFLGNGTFQTHGLYGQLTYSSIIPQGSPEEAKAFLLHNPNSTAPLEVGRIARKALAVAAQPSPQALKDLIEEIRFFVRKVDELATKVDSLTEGASVKDFLEEALRWEIAWNYSPEFLLEALGAEAQNRVGLGQGVLDKLKESLRKLPPLIQSEELGTYSRLYAMGKGVWSPENPFLPMPLPWGFLPMPLPWGFLPMPLPWGGWGGIGTPTPFFIPGQFLKTPPTYNLASRLCQPQDPPEICRLAYTVAPYLPYAYMDHYEVLNRLGVEAIGALANLRSRQIMGLIYIALMVIMALYIFRALVQIFGTLFEGMAPLGRGMVSGISRAVGAVAEVRPFAPVILPPSGASDQDRNTAPSFGPLENLLKEEQKRSQGLKETLQGLEKSVSELTEDEGKRYREELRRLQGANPLAETLSKEGFMVYSLSIRKGREDPNGEVLVLELPIRRLGEEDAPFRGNREELGKKLAELGMGEGVVLGKDGRPYPFLVGLLDKLTEEAKQKLGDLLASKGWMVGLERVKEEEFLVVRVEDGRILGVFAQGKHPRLHKALEELKKEEESHPLRALEREMEMGWEDYLKRIEVLLGKQGYTWEKVTPELYKVKGKEEEGRPSFLLVGEGSITPKDFYARFGGKKPSSEEANAFLNAYGMVNIPTALPYSLAVRVEALLQVKPRENLPFVNEMPIGYSIREHTGKGLEGKAQGEGEKEKKEYAASTFAKELEENPQILRKLLQEIFYAGTPGEKLEGDYRKIFKTIDPEKGKLLLAIGKEELDHLRKKVRVEQGGSEVEPLRSELEKRAQTVEMLVGILEEELGKKGKKQEETKGAEEKWEEEGKREGNYHSKKEGEG